MGRVRREQQPTQSGNQRHWQPGAGSGLGGLILGSLWVWSVAFRGPSHRSGGKPTNITRARAGTACHRSCKIGLQEVASGLVYRLARSLETQANGLPKNRIDARTHWRERLRSGPSTLERGVHLVNRRSVRYSNRTIAPPAPFAHRLRSVCAMFAEFRARYPSGSLTSEIIEVSQGKFIVRAAVSLDGIVLATGFGAAEQLEEAEDRARARAMEAVGLFLEPADRGQAQLVGSAPTYQLPASIPAPAPIPIATPIEADLHPPAPIAPPMYGNSYGDSYSDSDGDLPTVEPEWPPEPEPAPAPAPKRSRRTSSPAPTPPPPPAPEPAPAPTPAVDLSDAIAQTDVLMKRLGWNKQQGVEYLQMAFGKRTRAQLTDDELLQFLQHLQMLADDPDF